MREVIILTIIAAAILGTLVGFVTISIVELGGLQRIVSLIWCGQEVCK